MCIGWFVTWPPKVCSMQLFSHSHNNVPQEAEQIVFAVVHFLYLSGERTEENLFPDICKNAQIGVFVKPCALRTDRH